MTAYLWASVMDRCTGAVPRRVRRGRIGPTRDYHAYQGSRPGPGNWNGAAAGANDMWFPRVGVLGWPR